MELIRKPPKTNNIQKAQQQAKPVNMPLGTAAWHHFEQGSCPIHEIGDIYAGYTKHGDPIGIKDQSHICVTAKTRSGKGTDFIVTNIITWPGSLVVIDPKGENAILTARRRGQGSRYARGFGQKVAILDPFGEASTDQDDFHDLKASFNPMDVLSIFNPESVDDAARIADSIIVSETNSSDVFWNEAARDFIKAVMLHVVSSEDFEPEQRNLITVRDLILEGYAELKAMLDGNLEGGDGPTAYGLLFRAMRKNQAFHCEVAKAGERFARMEDNSARMLESIAQVACTNLDFLGSVAMQNLVRKSSFNIAELKTNPKGISLYLCLPQRYMHTHFRFLRMMINLILAEMERIKHQPKSGHSVLMVLDEFAALKRMQAIENAAAHIAGYGVQMMFVVQTLSQLKENYKENWQTLFGNCSTKVFFCNDDPFTRETVSKLIGDTEVIREVSNQSASSGKSTSNTKGFTIGQSSNQTYGYSSSMSHGPQGMNFSSSSSSSHGTGTSLSVSQSDTYGRNNSETAGISQTIHKRPLMAPDEVGRFFGNPHEPMSLVLVSGHQPIALKRKPYFKISSLRGHYDPHPDHKKPLLLTQLKYVLEQEEQARIAAKKRAEELAEIKRQEEYEKTQRDIEEWQEKERLRCLRAFKQRQEREREEWWERFWLIFLVVIAVAIGLFILFSAPTYKPFIIYSVIAFIYIYKVYDDS